MRDGDDFSKEPPPWYPGPCPTCGTDLDNLSELRELLRSADIWVCCPEHVEFDSECQECDEAKVLSLKIAAALAKKA